MCTLVVAAHVLADRPLVVVANRDEQLDRASSPPFRWQEPSGGDLGFFAPRDEVAGGTWLGVNDHGVFVGITNRYLGGRDATRASRGELVVQALGLPSARAIHEAMRKVDPARYNGFHLVYADERDVLATFADGRHLAQVALGKGVHAITERSFGAGDDRVRLGRILTAWDAAQEKGDLEKVLTEHDAEDPLDATCVHYPPLNYGTRSAMLLQRTGGTWKMRWAEGPPCVTPFRDTLGP
jgi:uncharacterized protein with NRDE domain